MTDITVLTVPQWQGSGAAAPRDLVTGAGLLTRTVPAARRLTADVPDTEGTAGGGVRGLDVLTAVAADVRARLATVEDDLVVTVGGDCGVELEPVTAAAARHGDALALVWFDAHGDLNTPASSPSGAFHGMILRTLLGDGPAELRPARPLRPQQVVLAGGRALDPAERDFIARSGLRHVTDLTTAPDAVADAVADTGAEAVYVHIDLDVLDPGAFASLGFPEPGGVTPAQLLAAVRSVTGRVPLAGMGITEYAPARPKDQETLSALVPGLLRKAA
jgi:arginase